LPPILRGNSFPSKKNFFSYCQFRTSFNGDIAGRIQSRVGSSSGGNQLTASFPRLYIGRAIFWAGKFLVAVGFFILNEYIHLSSGYPNGRDGLGQLVVTDFNLAPPNNRKTVMPTANTSLQLIYSARRCFSV